MQALISVDAFRVRALDAGPYTFLWLGALTREPLPVTVTTGVRPRRTQVRAWRWLRAVRAQPFRGPPV
jgi:hypothetical protein